MLTREDLNKIRAILSEGLGIREDVNLAYYLDAIDETNQKLDYIDNRLDELEDLITGIIDTLDDLIE